MEIGSTISALSGGKLVSVVMKGSGCCSTVAGILLACAILQTVVPVTARASEVIAPPVFINAEFIRDAELRAAVADYYWRERNHDWSETYAYRRMEYHDLVPFSVYARLMAKDSIGVDLTRLEILEVNETTGPVLGVNLDASTEIRIRFYEWVTSEERLANECFGSQPCGRGRFFVDEVPATIWFRRDNDWKCLECGRQETYSLNGRMVLDE